VLLEVAGAGMTGAFLGPQFEHPWKSAAKIEGLGSPDEGVPASLILGEGGGGYYVVPMFHVEHSSRIVVWKLVVGGRNAGMFHVEHSSSNAFIRRTSCQKQSPGPIFPVF